MKHSFKWDMVSQGKAPARDKSSHKKQDTGHISNSSFLAILETDHTFCEHVNSYLERGKYPMSSTRLFRFSGIILFLGAVIAVIQSIIQSLFFPEGQSPEAPISVIQSPLFPVNLSLVLLAVALFLIGLPGFYVRLAGQRGGALGLIGTLLTALSYMLTIGAVAVFFVAMPLLADKAPHVLKDLPESGLAVFGLGGVVTSTIGPILLGIAVIRTRSYPQFVGILLIVSGVLSPTQIFLSGFLNALVSSLSVATIAVAFGWAGMLLARQPETTAAETSYPVQEMVR